MENFILKCKVAFTQRTAYILVLLACLLYVSGCAHRKPEPIAYQQTSAFLGEDVVSLAKAHKGVPYKYGGSTPETGFDCSGLIYWAYQQQGVPVPRTAKEQMKAGRAIPKSELEAGDIVAFRISSRRGYHTGIYTESGKFIHSPSKGKYVTETKLSSDYWQNRYIGARRIIEE